MELRLAAKVRRFRLLFIEDVQFCVFAKHSNEMVFNSGTYISTVPYQNKIYTMMIYCSERLKLGTLVLT